MPERFTLPPVITGSTWSNVMESLWTQARRGVEADDDGTIAPKWTNREAAAIIAGMRELGRGVPGGFALWYQFAALAYAWEPGVDRLDATPDQADRMYPPEAAVQLNLELQRITNELDDARHSDPRLALVDVFDRASFQAEVETALAQDGAQAAFKIPLPACKDPRTGKPTKPIKDPRTGKWTCPGGVVTVDDPLTAIVKIGATIAIPLAIILVAYGVMVGKQQRRGRRKRK